MKKDEIFFLSLGDVIEIHRDQINRYGGLLGMRDQGLLQSALAMPLASFEGHFLHSNLFEMAAAYAFHLCKNHPFFDGNKRTALVCALIFLEMNDLHLSDPGEALVSVMLNVAEGKMEKQELANTFQKMCDTSGKY